MNGDAWLLIGILALMPCWVCAEQNTQAIAFNCLTCHQSGSNTADDALPDLQTLSEQKILQALLAFKYDKKPATLMPRIAKGYSDAELAAVAGYLTQH